MAKTAGPRSEPEALRGLALDHISGARGSDRLPKLADWSSHGLQRLWQSLHATDVDVGLSI